ncbi:MAG TPA: DUF72 domain-containing protein, partial [Longimicrobiales bacterium]|nr:DUF72 domain-containing protein [Longimicrobiales bacterium]
TQLGLFPDAPRAPRPPAVGPAEPSAELLGIASQLPREVRLGTSSWSFPGWHSLVYDRVASESALAGDGLAAYAAHPLLRSVCVDRSFYRPLTVEQLEAYASVVPDDFRFVVKADRLVTSPLDPEAVPGARARNARFLDAVYATEQVVLPLVEGMGPKAGVLLFQFPPMPVTLVGGRAAFLERLQRFLESLPRGPTYALELRTPSFLTEDYVELLDNTGAAHCYNVHPAMSSLTKQLEVVQSFYQPVLLIRWMLRPGLEYEAARLKYEPFDRLVDEDRATRDLVARTALDGLLGEREVIVIANNKAEGSAPLTLFRLADRIARWGAGTE